MAKIIECRVQNIGKISDAVLALEGRSAGIGGRNGHGKSTLLNALKMLSGDKRIVPEQPVQVGKEAGSIVATYDTGHRVEMFITPDRKVKFTIRNENGEKLQTSVGLVKELWGGEVFDPGEWMKFDDKKRVQTLLQVVGLDFSDIEKRRGGLYEERTEVGREVKRLEGQLSGLTFDKEAPDEEVSLADLTAEYEDAQGKQREVEARQQQRDVRLAKIDEYKERIERIDAKIEELKRLRIDAEDTIAENTKAITALDKIMETTVVPDISAIRAKMNSVEETNAEVREKAKHRQLTNELRMRNAGYERLTKEIAELDAEQRELVESAKFPISGISYKDGQILYEGLPLSQAGESAQWKVAVAMMFALNPGGVVILSQSGGLDIESRRAIAEEAARRGVQYLFEVVDDAEDVQIVISEGTIIENRLAATV